jgi:hypothetical protein
MTTTPEWDFEAGVLENINAYTGVDLQYVLGIPKKPLVGDRVLYILRGGRSRASELRSQRVAGSALDPELLQTPTHPHVAKLDSIALESYPNDYDLRPTDLLGPLCFRAGQRDYLLSRHLLPSRDWDLRWMLGAIMLSGRRLLAYADFRNSRVGLVFTEPFYTAHGEPERQKRQASRLLERLQGALTLKNRYSRRDAYRWIKVINVAGGPQFVALMGKNGELNIEEIPYPDH